MERLQFWTLYRISALKGEFLIEAYGFHTVVQTTICIKTAQQNEEKVLHFLRHIGQFIFCMCFIFFSWLRIRVMNFNKNDIDHGSKYTSQQRCNYRNPPPIITSREYFHPPSCHSCEEPWAKVPGWVHGTATVHSQGASKNNYKKSDRKSVV